MPQTATHRGYRLSVGNSRKHTVVTIEGDLDLMVPPPSANSRRVHQPAPLSARLVGELNGSTKPSDKGKSGRLVFTIKKCSVRAALSLVKAKIDSLLSRAKLLVPREQLAARPSHKDRARPVKRPASPAYVRA